MSEESVKKVGYLSKLPVKGIVKKWNRRWFILHSTTLEGVVRLEYYDSQETAKNAMGKRTIPLRDSTAITTTTGDKLHPYVFSFTSQIGHHILAADSQPELEEWMEKIKQVVAEDRLRRRRSKGQSMVTISSDSSFHNDSGISYKSMVDSGTYRVTVEENETSKRMNLSGTYSLDLTPTTVTLTASSGAKIFVLSYKYLKNYGKLSGQFHFQTGKNSPIGEGKIILVTTCSKEVFGVVHNNIKRLRESREARGKPPPPGPAPPGQRRQQPLKSVPRPQPQKSVEAPPAPKKSKESMGSQPASRHSTEVADNSIPGTYRSSKNMEDVQVDPNAVYAVVDKSKKKSAATNKQESKSPSKNEPPKKGKSKAPQQQQESLYAVPYEEDSKYKAPPVPTHKTSADTHESRVSYALVELDDDAFDDSFDDDDDDEDENNVSNLEPLAEGASNPFDGSDFAAALNSSKGTETPGQQQQQLAEVANAFETSDFGLGPSLQTATTAPVPIPAPPPPPSVVVAAPPAVVPPPPAVVQPQRVVAAAPPPPVVAAVVPPPPAVVKPPPAVLKPPPAAVVQTPPAAPAVVSPPPPTTATMGEPVQPQPDTSNQANMMNFDFDFGGGNNSFEPSPFPMNDDFFGSTFPATEGAAVGTADLANLDFGTLDDANFFEKLEAINLNTAPATLNKEDLDKFWTDMDASIPAVPK